MPTDIDYQDTFSRKGEKKWPSEIVAIVYTIVLVALGSVSGGLRIRSGPYTAGIIYDSAPYTVGSVYDRDRIRVGPYTIRGRIYRVAYGGGVYYYLRIYGSFLSGHIVYGGSVYGFQGGFIEVVYGGGV